MGINHSKDMLTDVSRFESAIVSLNKANTFGNKIMDTLFP